MLALFFSTNSQAATEVMILYQHRVHGKIRLRAPFSAKVLLALYFAFAGAFLPCSLIISIDWSFQSFSENTVGSGSTRRTAATDDVITTRFTEVLTSNISPYANIYSKEEKTPYPYLRALWRIPTVPLTAGTINSEIGKHSVSFWSVVKMAKYDTHHQDRRLQSETVKQCVQSHQLP
jgi:hypothetical protein